MEKTQNSTVSTCEYGVVSHKGISDCLRRLENMAKLRPNDLLDKGESQPVQQIPCVEEKVGGECHPICSVISDIWEKDPNTFGNIQCKVFEFLDPDGSGDVCYVGKMSVVRDSADMQM